MSAAKYVVGQRVWIYDINSRGRGPTEATIAKVGRTLVHVDGRRGRTEAYRIETGMRNDDWCHQHIRTDAERADFEARTEVDTRLRTLGVRVERSTYSTAQLTAVANILEGGES